MNAPPVHHTEESIDSLYQVLTDNLVQVVSIWRGGEKRLCFIIPLLCAVRLEAFINVAGKLNVAGWDALERRLSFPEKCKKIASEVRASFAEDVEPNRTAIDLFSLRNEIVHPKMVMETIDETITHAEYERRSSTFMGVTHPVRTQLNPQRVDSLLEATDQFVQQWGPPFLRGRPEYWLRWGSTGSFEIQANASNP